MTRQFDVVPVPSGGRGARLMVVLQSHHLTSLDSRLAAPLVTEDQLKSDGLLWVAVDFDGRAHTVVLSQLATLPAQRVGRALGSLVAYEDAIRRGLDRLFTGF